MKIRYRKFRLFTLSTNLNAPWLRYISWYYYFHFRKGHVCFDAVTKSKLIETLTVQVIFAVFIVVFRFSQHFLSEVQLVKESSYVYYAIFLSGTNFYLLSKFYS